MLKVCWRYLQLELLPLPRFSRALLVRLERFAQSVEQQRRGVERSEQRRVRSRCSRTVVLASGGRAGICASGCAGDGALPLAGRPPLCAEGGRCGSRCFSDSTCRSTFQRTSPAFDHHAYRRRLSRRDTRRDRHVQHADSPPTGVLRCACGVRSPFLAAAMKVVEHERMAEKEHEVARALQLHQPSTRAQEAVSRDPLGSELPPPQEATATASAGGPSCPTR